MFLYYNAHPKGLIVPDCVKRAISKAAEMDYHQVQLELNRYKKVTGAKQFNSDRNPDKYVTNVLHATKLSFPAEKGKPRMNGERFCTAYPKGNYILNMAGHWSCCVDGVIYDTWDCSEKCVYTAYKIPVATTAVRATITSGYATDTHVIEEKSTDEIVKKLQQDFNRYLDKVKRENFTGKFIAEFI